MRRREWAIGIAGVMVGFGLHAAKSTATLEAQQPAAAAVAVNPNEESLAANLFVQTSAEYRACCLQTYRIAADRLRALAKEVPPNDKQPAVVLDLDETVIDNGGFQTFIDREKLPFTEKWWTIWERDFGREVRLVPGAKEFLETAQGLGVAAVFISNRAEKHRQGAIDALSANGLSQENLEDRLLLRTDNSGDKTKRREKAEAKYKVLQYIGDNLRDLSEQFKIPGRPRTDDERRAAIAARNAAVDAAKARFGDDWFILPNPIYGEWRNLLGASPRSMLRNSAMKAE